jgi:hypothetical protein
MNPANDIATLLMAYDRMNQLKMLDQSAKVLQILDAVIDDVLKNVQDKKDNECSKAQMSETD